MNKAPKLASGALSWTGTIPQAPWNPLTRLQGGALVSDAGIPEAWVGREDSLLEIRPRFLEGEWPTLRAVLAYAQRNAAAITFWPDAAVVGVSFSVYLETPAVGSDIKPERGQYPGEQSITITVRTTDGAPIEPSYF